MNSAADSQDGKASVFDTETHWFESSSADRRKSTLCNIESFDLVPSHPSIISPKRMREVLHDQGRKIVCVSGGFDPLGLHHIMYMNSAKKLGSLLIVILNSDRFLYNKKGYYFLPSMHRKIIIENLRAVDYVYTHNPTDPDDMTVCEALIDLQPDIFAKGGDRSPLDDPIPEEKLCTDLGIEIVYGVGGFNKISSSSTLVEEGYKRFEKRGIK